MAVESKQLRYFVAVAEELSFRKAASRLHISQPPLSVQIKALEAELGTTLFNRSKHSVSLTVPGQILFDRAKEALLHVDYASEAVKRAGHGEAGLIRVGFVGSMPMLNVFSHLLRGFREQYPFIRLHLRHMSTGRQLRALANDELDIAFVRPSGTHNLGSVASVHLTWYDRLLLFCPVGHFLSKSDTRVDMKELAKEEFVIISSESGCGVHDQTIARCAAAGFYPKISQEANDLRTVLWLVAAGIGISLLPECYTRAGVANIAARPLENDSLQSSVLMMTRSAQLPITVNRFIEFAVTLRHDN